MKKLLICFIAFLFLSVPLYASERVVIINGDGEEVSDTNNALKIVGTGTAGTANAGVMTVQGIASGTTLPVTEASASAIKTAVEIMDDWDATDNCKIKVNSRATTTVTAVNAVTLDDDPTSVTSAAVTISEYQRVGIYFVYDETETGGGVSGALTVQVSPDNVTYFSAPFFDTAGGATPQTSESLSADGSYICWLDSNIPFAYMKVIVTGTATDVDDTILTSVYVYADK